MTGRAFAATWIKLGRPAVLVPCLAVAVAFAAIVTVGTFNTASRPGGSRLTDPPLYLDQMQRSGMLGELTGRTVMVLGAMSLAVCAGLLAGEFTSGMIRAQLVRQPRRTVWLGGTWLALMSFVALLAAAGTASCVAAALLSARGYGVDASAWTSGAGLLELAASAGNLVLALVGFSTLGSAAALLLRSAAAALGGGLVYALAERLFAGLVDGAGAWLPLSLLGSVASGGDDNNSSYGRAVLLSACWLAVEAAVAGLVFARRDVLE